MKNSDPLSTINNDLSDIDIFKKAFERFPEPRTTYINAGDFKELDEIVKKHLHGVILSKAEKDRALALSRGRVVL